MLAGRVPSGLRVLVIDEEYGYQGTSAAEFLLDRGKEVAIVTSERTIGSFLGATTAPPVFERLFTKGIVLHCNLSVVRIEEGRAVAKNVWSGREEALAPFDAFVYAYGGEAVNDLEASLARTGPSVGARGRLLRAANAPARDPRRTQDRSRAVRLRSSTLGLNRAPSQHHLPSPWAEGQTLVYFGTYTDGRAKESTSPASTKRRRELSAPELAAKSVNPSFLAVHPSGRFLYAVNEVDDDGTMASAFSIEEPLAGLRFLNQSSSKGAGPCYLSLDRTGRHLLVANYGGGSVTVIPVGSDGTLGPATASAKHPGSDARAHSIDVDACQSLRHRRGSRTRPRVRLSLSTQRAAHSGEQSRLRSLDPGAGPRHVALHPVGRFACVLNELSLTLTTMRYDAERGVLTAAQTVSSLPDGVGVAKDFSGAEVLVHPGGRFLYASNRGHDTIAVFAIGEDRRRPSPGRARLDSGKDAARIRNRSVRTRTFSPRIRIRTALSYSASMLRVDGSMQRGRPIEVGSPVAVAFVVKRGDTMTSQDDREGPRESLRQPQGLPEDGRHHFSRDQRS